jgi:hypothetical protein
MKDVVDFLWIVFIQPARNAGVLSKTQVTFFALLGRFLNLVAMEAFDVLYFFKLHALGLASLFELE